MIFSRKNQSVKDMEHKLRQDNNLSMGQDKCFELNQFANDIHVYKG